ncbi:MAG: ABC transporter permease [Mycobacteriaceae bacterium]
MTTVPATEIRRSAPPLGGFNLTFLGLEVRRMLRNRRTMVFTLIMPVAFFFLFGATSAAAKSESVGVGNRTAYVMISVAAYGAILATTSGGANVSVERAQGWSRQLRLTPLHPVAYVAMKIATAMVLGLLASAIVFVVGRASGARIPTEDLLVAFVICWLGAVAFAAFGLFMGYLLPSENVMQILGPVLAVLAFLGGLFVPLEFLGATFQTIAKFTPVYGLGELARHPLTHHALVVPALNILAWTVLFAAGAALLFRRDTRRV